MQNGENKLCEKNEFQRTRFQKKSNESYALNCQFVLALMQLGGGNSESETLLNFLNLPNGSAFKKKTFGRVQDAIRKEIVKISNDSMREYRDLEIEVMLVYSV